jgi:hypothetical protein
MLTMYLNVTGQAKMASCWLATLTGSSCLRYLARSRPVFDRVRYACPTTVDPARVFDVIALCWPVT